jgi:leucyl aminopeptidase
MFRTQAPAVNLIHSLQSTQALVHFVYDDQVSENQVLLAMGFKGSNNETLLIPAEQRTVYVGLGVRNKATLETFRQAAGKATTTARDSKAKEILLNLEAFTPDQVGAAVEGSLMSLYAMNDYRTKDLDKVNKVTTINVLADASAHTQIMRAVKINEATNLTRDLVVAPGNVLTATQLAKESQTMAQTFGLKATVYGKEELTKMGFGGLLAVNQGSVEPPAFIVLEHNGGKAGEAPIAIVGKGVTFDTGGISIKPSEGMDKMKYDMGGAGATVGIMQAVASLQLPINVVGLIPATDNMPSATAIKPGDVFTSYSGQTVEVLNTDAEGRLILCDALTYAVKDIKAKAIVDMATLTGACVIALGSDAIGLMGNHQGLADQALAAGEKTGDRAWQLPLWKEYNDMLKSEIADMKNIGGREAGTISAACFLARFVDDTPWIHLDIAGTAWTEKEKPYRPKGPTAAPVRMVVEMLENFVELTPAQGTKF